MARKHRFRFEFVLKTCDGKHIFRAQDIAPVRDWLDLHFKQDRTWNKLNYRTEAAFGGRWFEGARICMDDPTQAVHFMLRWSEDVRHKKDNGYSSIW